eukprot:SAG25_NODE_236_length_11287_cov_246.398999_7_plen_291_part_00
MVYLVVARTTAGIRTTQYYLRRKFTQQNTGRRGGGGAADDARHVAHGEPWSQAGYQSVVDAFMEALPHSHLTFLDIGYASTRDPVQRSPHRSPPSTDKTPRATDNAVRPRPCAGRTRPSAHGAPRACSLSPPPSLFLGSVAVSGRGDHWCAVLAPQASFASHCARGASAVGVTMPSLAVHLIGMVVHQCTLLRRRGHQRCCLWLANGEHGASIITRTCTAPAVAAAPLLAGTGSAGPLPTVGAAAGAPPGRRHRRGAPTAELGARQPLRRRDRGSRCGSGGLEPGRCRGY